MGIVKLLTGPEDRLWNDQVPNPLKTPPERIHPAKGFRQDNAESMDKQQRRFN